jgi:hypothetical protein
MIEKFVEYFKDHIKSTLSIKDFRKCFFYGVAHNMVASNIDATIDGAMKHVQSGGHRD